MKLLTYLTNEQLNQYIKYREYKSNQIVFDEQSFCDYLGIIIEGEILIKTYTYYGKEEIINLVQENDLFGQFLLFSSQPLYLGTGIANRKTKIAVIKKAALMKLFSENQAFLEAYLNQICSESLKIKQQAKLLAHKNIRDRIMYYFKLYQKNQIITIKSVTDFANILSIPRPSLSRELIKMEQEGLIKKINKQIYLKILI